MTMKPFMLNMDPDTTVTSHQLEHQLDSCDPLACVLFSHSPSVHMYYALRTRLETCSEGWLQEFISLDGLDSLLDSLKHMGGPQFNGFSDAILQIDCLSCIRAILNSKVGMNAFINSQKGVEKLLKGVDLVNTLPRKHVFEILSAVCVYNAMGYQKLMDAMEKYRKEKPQLHKLSFAVNELKIAETVPHKVALLTFINAVISSTSDRGSRCRIRNEFTGLGLLDVISFLQKEENDEDLYVQLQAFQEKKFEDELSTVIDSNIDFNSPQDLADTIQSKVFGGPKMVCFVNILQDLLAIETMKREDGLAKWKVLERHVHHIVHATHSSNTLMYNEENSTCMALTAAVESDRILSNCSCLCHSSDMPNDILQGQQKKLNRFSSTSSMKKDSTLKTSADSGFIVCEEKNCSSGCEANEIVKREIKMDDAHSDKPTSWESFDVISCQKHEGNTVKTQDENHNYNNNLKDQDDVDSAHNRKHLSLYDNMVSINECLSDGKTVRQSYSSTCLDSKDKKPSILISQENQRENDVFDLKINSHGQNSGDHTTERRESKLNINVDKDDEIVLPSTEMRNLKWIKLTESLIGNFPEAIWARGRVSCLKVKPDYPQVERLFHEHYDYNMAETPLLSKKTRINLNIFLNRCEEDPNELIKKLVRVDGPSFSLSFIKHLVDIFPEPDEVKHLKFYNGNLLELGQAEQFVLHLSDVPDYDIVLNGQLQKAEFRSMASRLRTVLNSMLDSSKGQYNGYAKGFKLSSLARLSDLKSQEPGHTFVHYLITCLETSDKKLLTFLDEIPILEKAASHSLTNIKTDFDKLNAQINSFVRQLAVANPIIRNGFDNFMEEVKREFRSLQGQISELKTQSKSLATFFCESDSFELQACFTALVDFFKELKLCQQEKKLMQIQKATADKHTKMLNQQAQKKQLAFQFGQKAGASSSVMEEKKLLVDTLLAELHRGNFSPVIHPATALLKEAAERQGLSHQFASTYVPIPSILPVMSAPCFSAMTPERITGTTMELSRITLMGTPMMNRPSSEMFDDDVTITATKAVNRSENDLLDEPVHGAMKVPIMPVPKPLTKAAAERGRGHYRSRSDLADSINAHTKWIRYYDNLTNEKAPLAKPESSMTVATLNLEPGSSTRHLYVDNDAVTVTLESGPKVELPPSGNDLDRHGKKTKSAISKMINKISRRVLKPRNIDIVENCNLDENIPMNGRKLEKRQHKPEKSHSRGGSIGKATSQGVVKKECDKENVYEVENTVQGPFDRQTKNPIRLSNRFRNKILK